MSIASELIDDDHPPPPAILLATDFDQKTFWKVKPSRSFIPFRLNLPLNVGPGPFQSVRARIRYVVHGYEKENPPSLAFHLFSLLVQEVLKIK